MQIILRIVLALWQFPQTIAGLLTLLFTRGKRYDGEGVWGAERWLSGVCLGEIIILHAYYHYTDVCHEMGHRQQSRILGPLYLLVVGIPSAVGNLIDRYGHRDWTDEGREKWYYALPWEADADARGGVNRLY